MKDSSKSATSQEQTTIANVEGIDSTESELITTPSQSPQSQFLVGAQGDSNLSVNSNTQTTPDLLGQQQNQARSIVRQDRNKKVYKPRLSKYLLVGLIAILLIGASVLAYLVMYHPKNNPVVTSHTVNRAMTNTVALSDNMQNGYTLFQKSSDPNSYAVQVSLIDPSSKLVQSATSSYPLNLYATLSDGLFLLKENDFDVSSSNLGGPIEPYGGSFWIASKSGIQKASSQVNNYLTQGAGTQTAIHHIFAAGQQQVVYPACDPPNGNNTGCSLFLLDILTGKQEKLPSTAIQDYLTGFTSIGDENDQISNDGKYLYVLEPKLPNYSLITYDYRADKIIASKTITGLKSSYSRFWIAPDGQTIAYEPDAGNKINIVTVATNKQTQAILPPNWVTESWSGETTETGPLWSPDSTKVAYTSYAEGDISDETISVLDVKSPKNTVIANHVGQQRGSGEIPNQYANFRWMSNSQLVFNEILSSDTSSSKASQYGNNYLYNVSSGNLQTLSTVNGGSIGRYNGSY